MVSSPESKMTKAHVIIGANFGDEGKGLVTDYLASKNKENVIVIRFNGGAQAGHTVQLQNGIRHVFSHFGSGTLAGATTYLSCFFISNPILFCQEFTKLERMNCNPIVYIDPYSTITTPYDMLINQIIEQTRKGERHGSCGVGIGETVERSLHEDFHLTVKDCLTKRIFIDKLKKIRDIWLPQRLAQLNISAVTTENQKLIDSDIIFTQFLSDTDFFIKHIKLADITIVTQWDSVIFEGAQGLLLDQEMGWFPHVTRSYTGLRNVLSLAKQINLSALDIHYITRTYLTRHGAGPLPNETPDCPCPYFEDKTNVRHPFQGTLRFAPLNIDLLKSSIAADLKTISQDIDYEYRLAVTCLDQITDTIPYLYNNILKKSTVDDFLFLLSKEINRTDILCSHSPTREGVFLRRI